MGVIILLPSAYPTGLVQSTRDIPLSYSIYSATRDIPLNLVFIPTVWYIASSLDCVSLFLSLCSVFFVPVFLLYTVRLHEETENITKNMNTS